MRVNVLNRSSKKIFQGETPNEKWNRKKPKIDHLMVFGSIVQVKIIGRVRKPPR